MSMAPRVEAHLNRVGVRFDLVEHPLSASSLETARTAHISPNQVAKAVITHDGEQFCMCVIPASHRLVMEWLNQQMHGNFRLATEEELQRLFDDCEPGAVPALGQVYGMSVIWDESLKDIEDLYLESGDHRNLIHINHAGFMELMGLQEHRTISTPADSHSEGWIH